MDSHEHNTTGLLVSWEGYCPICRRRVTFSSSNKWLRDHLKCSGCGSIPRERAVMLVLESVRRDWRDLAIHEAAPGARGASEVIKRDCSKYLPTHYFCDIPLGQTHRGYRCEDIEHQLFPDQTFDVVIAQDVYEHIFDPAAATAEIYRTLKPGGISIITTGVWKDKLKTEQWARIEPDGKITHLILPPEYHGNPVNDAGSLVTFKFGYDIVDLLATWAPFNVELRRFNDRHHGIVGEFTDVVVCTKSLTAPLRSPGFRKLSRLELEPKDLLAQTGRQTKMSGILETSLPEEYHKRNPELITGAKEFVDVLQSIHKFLDPRFYLEIGVWYGRSLALAKCPSVGVDPHPQLSTPISSQTQVCTSTSDDFFKSQASSVLTSKPDLALIDGLHLFECALRDFINVERHCHVGSLVLFDDIFPNHPLQAKRNRVTGGWTGDVWKIIPCLKEYRPDLIIAAIDSRPTGMLLVTRLDPESTILSSHYDEILEKYQFPDDLVLPPPSILDRHGALLPDDPVIFSLLTLLRESRDFKPSELKWCLDGWLSQQQLPRLGQPVPA